MSSMKTGRFIPAVSGRNRKPLELPDCVHLTERCRCGILRVEECQGEHCAFRKTEAAYRESRRKWMRALCAMRAEEQEKTAVKYYNGQMPWKEI